MVFSTSPFIRTLRAARVIACVLSLSLVWQSSVAQTDATIPSREIVRPNVVLLLADDLGFSDIAPYGSEISTPHLTALAENGVSFTNYHTAANCAPARAMLLTGVDSHLAGVPNIPEMIPPVQRHADHYQGVLGESGADNWEQKPYLPIYDKANWYADGKEYQLPEDFYSSRFLIDKTIEFIDSNSASEQPFFAYVPFQAVHMPVQAPQEFIDNHMGVYDQGWHQLRQARLKKAIELDVVADTTQAVSMPTTEDWDSLSDERKRYEAKRMAVYAAMIEAMDHHIGRLVDHLKRIGKYENTLFIFTSDNGSEPTGAVNPTTLLSNFALSRQGYSSDYERLGLKGSFNSISPSFASAAASPLAYYKFFVGEGGLRVPLIIAGNGVAAKGLKTDVFSHVTDITPTILQLTHTQEPSSYFGGRKIEPISGRDISQTLSNHQAQVRGEEDQDAVGYELAGNAALFLGDYKIVLHVAAPGDGQWRLFNIKNDPGETNDLSSAEPKRLQRMLNLYHQYEIDNQVLPITANFDLKRQVIINGVHARFGPQILNFIILMFVLIPFYVVYRTRKNLEARD